MTEQQIKAMEGITSDEAHYRQKKYGKNELISKKKEGFLNKILKVISEPMFLLLIVAAVIYLELLVLK